MLPVDDLVQFAQLEVGRGGRVLLICCGVWGGGDLGLQVCLKYQK